LKRQDLLLLYELDVFEAIDGWKNFRSFKGSTESTPPWRNAEARHLLQHVNGESMGIEEIRILGGLPAINSYPDLLPKLLKEMVPSRKRKAFVVTDRYSSHMKSKRFTFLYTLKSADLIAAALDSPWHLNDKNGTKYRLRIARKTKEDQTYTVTIEPPPINLEMSEIFQLTNVRDEHYRNVYAPADKGLAFTIDQLKGASVITFGATVFV